MRKGQVSIFVVIGIIILLIFSAVLFFQNKRRTIDLANPTTDIRLEPIKIFVSECLLQTGIESMKELGKQGRLYPDVYLRSGQQKIAYFYYRGEGHFPTKLSSIEEDVSRNIGENINKCLNSFDGFNYEIKTDEKKLRVITDFKENELQLEMHYPITINFDGTVSEIADFEASIKSDYPDIYEVSRQIYTKVKNDPEWVDMDFLVGQRYPIKLIRITPDTLVYEITDNDGLDSELFIYRFGVKYRL